MKSMPSSQVAANGRQLGSALVAAGVTCDTPHAGLERGASPRGVPYIFGGWSSETRQELATEASAYSVTLVFAQKGWGEYIADVNVRVSDDQGQEILALRDAGPIVLFGLPPGTYQIEVTHKDKADVLTRTIMVGPRTRRQTVFYWPGTAISD